MFQKTEFQVALVRKGMTLKDVATALKISLPTVSRKINSKGDFFRYEIEIIRELLDLTPSDLLKIFFAPNITEM